MRGLFAVAVGVALGLSIAVILAAREPAPASARPPGAEGA